MTNVRFVRNSGKLVSFKIKGHAQPRESKEKVDLTCAAISAISISIANGILEVLKIKAKHSMKDGFLSLTLENQTLEDIEKCQVLLETMLLGLKNVELDYSDYIKVEIEEV